MLFNIPHFTMYSISSPNTERYKQKWKKLIKIIFKIFRLIVCILLDELSNFSHSF